MALTRCWSERDLNLGSPQATYPGLHPAHGISVVAARPSPRKSGERSRNGQGPRSPRGVKLGGRMEDLKNADLGRQRAAEIRRKKAKSRTADLLPVIDAIRAEGITSATGIAKALNERELPTTRGGRWQAVQVKRILQSATSPHRR